MKATVLAALATLILGIGFAHAQGVPAGYHPLHYGRITLGTH